MQVQTNTLAVLTPQSGKGRIRISEKLTMSAEGDTESHGERNGFV